MENQLSVKGRRWKQGQEIADARSLFALLARHYPKEETNAALPDPTHIPDMGLAVERILRAISDGERVMIFGDFDADGITSTVMLVDGLRRLGAKVSYRIPDRVQDSHGLKAHHIEEIASKDVRLIITCDCGTNDRVPIAAAAQQGIDVIITDHHECDPSRTPEDAIAHLNPKRADNPFPDSGLSGAGVVLFLLQALAQQALPQNQQEDFLSRYHELCALGMIADCMDMTPMVQHLCRQGLSAMRHTRWPALAMIFESARIAPEAIDEETVSFQIAPLLNAASRLGDVLKATEFFLGDASRHPERLEYLLSLNARRKERTQELLLECRDQIEGHHHFFLCRGETWEPGIVGLLCSRLVEEYHRPAIALTRLSDGTLGASARAPQGYSIIEALRTCPELFIHFGGHTGAAGFRMEEHNLPAFRAAMEAFFDTRMPPPETKPLAHISPTTFSVDIARRIAMLGPFGVGREKPLFGAPGTRFCGAQPLGSSGAHYRLLLERQGQEFGVTAFFFGEAIRRLLPGQQLDIAYHVGVDYWQGRPRMQLFLFDFLVRE